MSAMIASISTQAIATTLERYPDASAMGGRGRDGCATYQHRHVRRTLNLQWGQGRAREELRVYEAATGALAWASEDGRG
ncbi:MAG: hypothetical protein ACXVPX_02540 [Actinomycetota bacterium]